ncbi:type II toxin-antitoxin system RelE/ParE family toxin [Planktothrix paucivesiculata]|uniref:Plasmid stabilization system protein n=1 Tax=Planktothrix paucivesiculata PCC 9631 TaxID=671071 RepID=A0A7Z9BH30_9CYAN|nr:type II toxin-antitoxin system RelE/ParE family toxin [Planktothrix paucivesiculata]VXD12951.1 Plasmid stabilization system protein [Planktothrix paucivesiculata PCC 9631]
MTYRVEISSVAEAEADSAFLHLSQVTSLAQASQWYSGLLKAIESLSTMPKRCTLARENEYFSQEIRQFLYGQRRNSYRILFTVFEETSTVRILHIRHSSQPVIGEAPED